MKNPTKKDILTPTAYKHLPRVMQMMATLEKERDRLGAPFLKKKFRYLDGTFVLLHAMIGFNKIVMWGGGTYPHLVLTNYKSSWSYDWYKDKAASFGFPDYSGDAPLKPSFNGRSQISDLAHLTYQSRWRYEKIDGSDLTYLGGLNNYEMTLFTDGDKNVFGRVGEKQGLVASLPRSLVPELSVPYGGLYLLSMDGVEGTWNQFNGNVGVGFNPANRQLFESWYWTPSFFVAQPDDPYNLKPGFYYGEYPYSNYNIDDPLETMTVTLKGVVAKRSTRGEYQEGWAEYVTEINGDNYYDLHFYFRALSVPLNPTFGYMRIVGTTADQMITTGWDGKGFASNLRISLDDSWQAFDLDMWSHNVFGSSGEESSGVSFVISQGTIQNYSENRARVYRYTGATTLLLETDQYHSHSVSHDGQYLAVFEGERGVITKVTVWDLFGKREPTLSGENVYSTAAVTEIISTESIAVGAITGCIIPHRKNIGQPDVYEPSALQYEINVPVSSPPLGDYSDYLPSLGVLRFGKRGVSPTFYKVVCKDGITAKYGVSEDRCFSSTIVVEDPDGAGGVKDEKLVGHWDYGGIFRGVIRGSFTGDHPEMRFSGTGNGETITLAENFSVLLYEDGTIGFEGYSGDLFVGDCIVEDGTGYKVDRLCENCGETYFLTASSSCGQTAETEITPDPSTPLSISLAGKSVLSDTVSVGDFFVASGGYGEFVYTISCGTIDESTGEVLDLSGCCGSLTVTVTDECGSVASVVARAPTGRWVFQYDINDSPCGATLSGWISSYGSCVYSTDWPDATDGSIKYEQHITKRICSFGCSVGGCTLYCDSCSCVNYVASSVCYPETVLVCKEPPGCTNTNTSTKFHTGQRVYRWEC